MNTYRFRSYMVRSDGTISKSNLNSRPYTSVEEVLADASLNNNDRRIVHDFIDNKWWVVVNGWLTSTEAHA